MSKLAPVITIDGSAGVGKGTTAAQIASRLNWHVLDSGAIYRVLGYAAQQRSIPLDDASALALLASQLNLTFNPTSSQDKINILLDDLDISDTIRTEQVGTAASQVARLGSVRDALLARQHAFRQFPGLVADGRDMGTHVFPDAALKFFLTASVEERAKRRYKQLKQKGISASISTLMADIQSRDERDIQRSVAPLLPAEDALILDTTTLNIVDVVAQVWQAIRDCPALKGYVDNH